MSWYRFMTPSAPEENTQGCRGWKAIDMTPSPPFTPCPLSTFSGTISGLRAKSLQSSKTQKIISSEYIYGQKRKEHTLSAKHVLVNCGMENMHGAIVCCRCHKGISAMVLNATDCLLMELQCFVRRGRKV